MGNLNLNNNMYQALFKDPRTEYLIKEALKDGKIDGKDDTVIKELRQLLETAAKSQDGKIDGEEDILLDALDSTGWFGTNEDLVKENLQNILGVINRIKNTARSAETAPNQLSFNIDLKTQDGVTGMFGATQNRSLHYVEEIDTSSAATQNTQTPQPQATAETPATAPQAGSWLDNIIDGAGKVANGIVQGVQQAVTTIGEFSKLNEQTALESVYNPQQAQEQRAIGTLQQQARALNQMIAQVPAERLNADIIKLSEAAVDNPAYVMEVLKEIGVPAAALQAAGVLTDSTFPEPVNLSAEQKSQLEAFLSGESFSEMLTSTPSMAEAYRQKLTQTLNTYAQDGSAGNYQAVKEMIYDHCYLFESAATAGEAAYQSYYQFKQDLLAVNQAELLNRRVSETPGPTSVAEAQNLLNENEQQNELHAINLASQALAFANQLDSSASIYNSVKSDKLRALVGELVELDAEGKIAGLKADPGRAQLDIMNEMWSEIERLGIEGGLGDDFYDRAFHQAVQNTYSSRSATIDNPAVQTLLQNPEVSKVAPQLLQNAELLEILGRPENAALLEAVLSDAPDAGAKIEQFFNEYYQTAFDFNLGFSSCFGYGGLGLGGSLSLGGASNLNYGACPPSPLGSLGLGLELPGSLDSSAYDPFASNLGFGNLGLNKGLGLDSLNYTTAGITTALQVPEPASGSKMSLYGVSQSDVEALRALLQGNQAAQQFVAANGASLNQTLQNSPSLAPIKNAVEAKTQFDELFWEQNSKLEAAQNSAQNVNLAQTVLTTNLQQAQISIARSLALPDSEVSAETKEQLRALQPIVSEALQKLAAGEPLPESPELDLVLKSVSESRSSAGKPLSELLQNNVRSHNLLTNSHELRENLRNALTDGSMQALLEKLPPEQKQLLEQMMGNDNGQTLVANMNAILNSSAVTPEDKQYVHLAMQQLDAFLKAAKDPDTTPESLREMGNQVVFPQLQSSAFDVLVDLAKANQYASDVRSELGEDKIGEVYAEMLNIRNNTVQNNLDGNGKLNRPQLYNELDWRFQTVLNSKRMVARAEEEQELENAVNHLNDPGSTALLRDDAIQSRLQQAFADADIELEGGFITPTQIDALTPIQAAALSRSLKSKIEQASTGMRALSSEQVDVLKNYLELVDYKVRHPEHVLADNQAAGESSAIANGPFGFGMDGVAGGDGIPAGGNWPPPGFDPSTVQMADGIAGVNPADVVRGNFRPGAVTDVLADAADAAGRMRSARETEAQANADYQKSVQTVTGNVNQRINATMGILYPNINTSQARSLSAGMMELHGLFASGQMTQDDYDRELLKLVNRFNPNPQLSDAQKLAHARTIIFNLSYNELQTRGLASPQQEATIASYTALMHKASTGEITLTPQELAQLNQSMTRAMSGASGGLDAYKSTLAGVLDRCQLGEGVDRASLKSNLIGVVDQTYSAADIMRETRTTFAEPDREPRPHTEGEAIAQEEMSVLGDDTGKPATDAPAGDDGDGIETESADVAVGGTGQSNPGAEGDIAGAMLEAVPEGLKAAGIDLDTEEGQATFLTGFGLSMARMGEGVVSGTPEEREIYGEALGATAQDTQTVMQARQRYNQATERAVEEFRDAREDYNRAMDELANILNENPNALNELRINSPNEQAQKISEQVDELADAMLAPQGQNSEEFLQKLISDFLNTIRDLDFKTRQLVLAQLAQKMLDNAITTFYKDKQDENNKHHEEALQRLNENFKQQVSQMLQASMAASADNGQAAAALSGELSAADVGNSLNMANLRESFSAMLGQTQQMSPSMVTDEQKAYIIEALFDNNPANDMAGILALAGAQASFSAN